MSRVHAAGAIVRFLTAAPGQRRVLVVRLPAFADLPQRRADLLGELNSACGGTSRIVTNWSHGYGRSIPAWNSPGDGGAYVVAVYGGLRSAAYDTAQCIDVHTIHDTALDTHTEPEIYTHAHAVAALLAREAAATTR